MHDIGVFFYLLLFSASVKSQLFVIMYRFKYKTNSKVTLKLLLKSCDRESEEERAQLNKIINAQFQLHIKRV